MKNLHRLETRVCKVCGSPFAFNAIPSKIAAGHGIFCSGICQRRGRRQRQLEDSFFARIGHITKAGCYLWLGKTDRAGYGKLGLHLAHRISYEFLIGAIPERSHVLHHCDNPPCVNPAHLFLGTNIDNTKDKVAKNRQARGAMFNRKLTDAIVLDIRERCRSGESQNSVARSLGVGQGFISRIINRKAWAHLP